jgi:hypothetical protein
LSHFLHPIDSNEHIAERLEIIFNSVLVKTLSHLMHTDEEFGDFPEVTFDAGLLGEEG